MDMSKEDFYSLTPDHVLEAVELVGYRATGEFQQLNSYENRVFDVAVENDDRSEDHRPKRLIVKFYRPGRWSKECIEEEHLFLKDLFDEGLPAISPFKINNKQTLFKHNGMWVAIFPKSRGRMVEELSDEDLKKIGRTLARLHTIGARRIFKHRPFLSTETHGYESLHFSSNFTAPEVKNRYQEAAHEILDYLDDELDEKTFISVHGDCHKGNLLMTDPRSGPTEFFFVDFDDCMTGTPVQDFWMFFSDESPEQEIDAFLTGYTEFRDFNESDLRLIPALRGLRIIYYSGWIAKRWEDPSFKRLFPQFLDYNHWASETEALERVLKLL